MRSLQQRSGRASSSSTSAPRQQRVVSASVFGKSKPGPPDAPKEIIQEGRKWIETILSRFGPVKARAQTVTTLDFEKPLLELDKRILDVSKY